jgi:hypothetical protein
MKENTVKIRIVVSDEEDYCKMQKTLNVWESWLQWLLRCLTAFSTSEFLKRYFCQGLKFSQEGEREADRRREQLSAK